MHARAAALLADDGVPDQRVAEHLLHAPPRGDATVVTTLRAAADAGAARRRLRRRRRGCSSGRRRSRRRRRFVDVVDVERGRSLLDAGDEDGARVLARVAQRAADPSVRVDAARHAGRGPRAPRPWAGSRRVCCATFWRRSPDDHREMRLELLVELAFVGGSTLDGRQEALRMIAAEAAAVDLDGLRLSGW